MSEYQILVIMSATLEDPREFAVALSEALQARSTAWDMLVERGGEPGTFDIRLVWQAHATSQSKLVAQVGEDLLSAVQTSAAIAQSKEWPTWIHPVQVRIQRISGSSTGNAIIGQTPTYAGTL